MQSKLSKLQKIILVYVGVTVKQKERVSINRREVTAGLVKLLNVKNKESFRVILSVSIKSLLKRNMLSRKGKFIGLTAEGKENTKEIINKLKEKYGKANWDILRLYYGSE